MSWLQEHVYLMSAGLDLRQGRGLVILRASPEHRMMGGQANCLFITRAPAHGLESTLVERRCPVPQPLLQHTRSFLTAKDKALSVHGDLKIEVANLAEESLGQVVAG